MLEEVPKKSPQDLKGHFQEQMGFLSASAAIYDGGISAEALRLATTTRVLVHDTPKSNSLLNQMEVKLSLEFLNTGMTITSEPGSEFVGAVLAPIVMGASGQSGPIYAAMLDKAGVQERQSFYTWWMAPVIGTHQGTFTRKDVVMALANVEGGAHVDPKMTQRYADLRRLGVGFTFSGPSGEAVQPNNPALPTMRQIAFELDTTVREQMADFLN
jgi:hypothetical protein